ncbi:hypothetical protein B0H16DRAFT_1513021 [Mycena metata]|uniref:Uncharacterized protein n=1 Tax=Mycena metata TaxID=1033252 RepID=A0AAD7JZ21_9AGAR|nr:hypothetical protein B0H16DRAFT_1513021 [Mycena metata]
MQRLYMYAPPLSAPPQYQQNGHYARPHDAYPPYPPPHMIPPLIGSVAPAPGASSSGACGTVGGTSGVKSDDPGTKLSDRVRRRCFNCCKTDTSTCRRSHLCLGEVLCTKCGGLSSALTPTRAAVHNSFRTKRVVLCAAASESR